MLSKQDIDRITAQLCEQLAKLFPESRIEALLFGSYARGDMESGSDVDLLVLVDSSREDITEKSWQIGNIAGDLSLDCGTMIMPIVENKDYYSSHIDLLPFFQNVNREGVRINA